MILYLSPGACSLADHIALHEAGFTFGHVRVDLKAKTTEAGKEGGNFMGWGAVPVNDEERAALKKIAETLGIEAPAAPSTPASRTVSRPGRTWSRSRPATPRRRPLVSSATNTAW